MFNRTPDNCYCIVGVISNNHSALFVCIHNVFSRNISDKLRVLQYFEIAEFPIFGDAAVQWALNNKGDSLL